MQLISGAAQLSAHAVIEISPEEHRQHERCIHALLVGLREVARPVVVDHALDPAGLVTIGTRAFEFRDVRGETQHQHKVTASAAPDGANVFGVNVVLRCVSPQESNCGLLGRIAGPIGIAADQALRQTKPRVLQVAQQRRLCVAAAALRPLNRLLIHARSKGR